MHFKSLYNHKEKGMSKNAQTKHCTICANAGLPKEVYSTHFIRESRDKSSRVTCPLLKNNICSKCQLKGHFASSCKVVIHKKPDVVKVEKPKISTKNTYDFGSESEDEPEPEPLPKQSEKDYLKRFTLECWQIENNHLLNNPEGERDSQNFFWDSKFKLFCSRKYKIVEKRVMTLNRETVILVVEAKKTGWADSDDEE
uniref:Nanos-type domain-containing protein n=1 Tax=viral metagenome TaxID=1070528 RepID=A0A6C0HS14_9ZZZZ